MDDVLRAFIFYLVAAFVIVVWVISRVIEHLSRLERHHLSSLPSFTFSVKTHPDPVECPICLSEVEDGETCRILPLCEHIFHIDCINLWLYSHSTCPLCRAPVWPQPVGEEQNRTEPVVYDSSSMVGVIVEVPGTNDSSSESSSSFQSPMSHLT